MLETVRRSRAEVLRAAAPRLVPAELRHFADQLARFNDDVTQQPPGVVPALTAAPPIGARMTPAARSREDAAAPGP